MDRKREVYETLEQILERILPPPGKTGNQPELDSLGAIEAITELEACLDVKLESDVAYFFEDDGTRVSLKKTAELISQDLEGK